MHTCTTRQGADSRQIREVRVASGRQTGPDRITRDPPLGPRILLRCRSPTRLPPSRRLPSPRSMLRSSASTRRRTAGSRSGSPSVSRSSSGASRRSRRSPSAGPTSARASRASPRTTRSPARSGSRDRPHAAQTRASSPRPSAPADSARPAPCDRRRTDSSSRASIRDAHGAPHVLRRHRRRVDREGQARDAGAIYRDRAARLAAGDGGRVCLVLGGGNVSSIPRWMHSTSSSSRTRWSS